LQAAHRQKQRRNANGFAMPQNVVLRAIPRHKPAKSWAPFDGYPAGEFNDRKFLNQGTSFIILYKKMCGAVINFQPRHTFVSFVMLGCAGLESSSPGTLLF